MIVLADGSRLTVDALVGKGGTLGIGSVTGFTAFIPETAMISLTVLGGKATYLADLKPKQTKSEPYLGVAWPPIANRSVKGNPLRLDSKLDIHTYDRGLGTHAKTTLEYDLSDQYRRFEAVVGIDATTGKLGRVPVQILVDGKQQPIEGVAELRAELGPIAIAIDVSKAKTLTLIVDFGPLGDANADVNWCDARLIRE